MNEFAQTLGEIAGEWALKSLDTLRYEAAGTESGFAVDAIKTSEGQRICIVMVFTELSHIQALENVLDFDDLVDPADWAKLSLLQFLMRTDQEGGSRYEDYRDNDGRRVALAFAATTPVSVSRLEFLMAHIAGRLEDR